MTTPGSSRPAESGATVGSQTLDRGLRALEILSDAGEPMSIAQLAEHLGVHRSNAYRILRTLEEHRFVLRDEAGLIRLGPRLAALGRGAAPALTQVAQPELLALANSLGMTAFVGVLDADEVITMVSIEPSYGHANVAQRPGARHPLHHGAPSHAVEASLTPNEHRVIFGGSPLSEAALEVKRIGYSISQDEIIQGLTAIAVPLRVHGEPAAALAVVTIGIPPNLDAIVAELQQAATRMSHTSW